MVSALARRKNSAAKKQAAILQRLKACRKQPDNEKCADCGEEKPAWASLLKPPLMGGSSTTKKMGIFCCYKCCSYHFQMGRDVCEVKNVKVADDWTEEEVKTMETTGNAIANAVYEGLISDENAKLSDGYQRPDPEDHDAQAKFVEQKYKDLAFFCKTTYQSQSSWLQRGSGGGGGGHSHKNKKTKDKHNKHHKDSKKPSQPLARQDTMSSSAHPDDEEGDGSGLLQADSLSETFKADSLLDQHHGNSLELRLGYGTTVGGPLPAPFSSQPWNIAFPSNLDNDYEDHTDSMDQSGYNDPHPLDLGYGDDPMMAASETRARVRRGSIGDASSRRRSGGAIVESSSSPNLEALDKEADKGDIRSRIRRGSLGGGGGVGDASPAKRSSGGTKMVESSSSPNLEELDKDTTDKQKEKDKDGYNNNYRRGSIGKSSGRVSSRRRESTGRRGSAGLPKREGRRTSTGKSPTRRHNRHSIGGGGGGRQSQPPQSPKRQQNRNSIGGRQSKQQQSTSRHHRNSLGQRSSIGHSNSHNNNNKQQQQQDESNHSHHGNGRHHRGSIGHSSRREKSSSWVPVDQPQQHAQDHGRPEGRRQGRRGSAAHAQRTTSGGEASSQNHHHHQGQKQDRRGSTSGGAAGSAPMADNSQLNSSRHKSTRRRCSMR